MSHSYWQRGGSPAHGWLTSLESGSLRSALEAYNAAYADAVSGRYEAAHAHLARSRELLPDLMPAQRLEVVLAAKGPTPGRGPARTSALAFRIGLATAALAGVFTLGYLARPVTILSGLGGDPVAVSPTANRPGSTPDGSQGTTPQAPGAGGMGAAQAVGIVLAGNADSIASLVVTIGSDTLHWPAAVRARATSVRAQAARRYWLRGIRARANGLTDVALRSLRDAVPLAAGTYLEDDALYELSLTQMWAGAPSDAAVTAAQLLRMFPSSIFANSTMHRLATTSSGRGRR